MQDVVIIDGVRTAIGRHAGALSGMRPDDMAALVIKEIVARTGIDPAAIEANRERWVQAWADGMSQ